MGQCMIACPVRCHISQLQPKAAWSFNQGFIDMITEIRLYPLKNTQRL
jgi:hypothetical protein